MRNPKHRLDVIEGAIKPKLSRPNYNQVILFDPDNPLSKEEIEQIAKERGLGDNYFVMPAWRGYLKRPPNAEGQGPG